jgi:hypothetical protein
VSGTLPLQGRAALATSSAERNASHFSSARQTIGRIPDTAKAGFKSLQPWHDVRLARVILRDAALAEM